MKIVISVGGSVLARDLSPEKFLGYAEAIKQISKENTVFVVTGGGKAARDYISVARALGANEAVCDLIGIDVTRLNARLLISALGEDAYFEPPLNYRDAKIAGYSGKIIVMGGVIPGQTTDAVSAILAEYAGADVLINATSIDGVYTSDPRKKRDAKKFETMTPRQLVEIVNRTEMIAGANSPVDLLAAKVIERSSIRTIVLNGDNPGNIVEAIRGRHTGTIIDKNNGKKDIDKDYSGKDTCNLGYFTDKSCDY
jgi:uridylate kinase